MYVGVRTSTTGVAQPYTGHMTIPKLRAETKATIKHILSQCCACLARKQKAEVNSKTTVILFHTYPTNDAAPRQDDVGSAQVALSAHFEPLRWNFRKTMRYPKMQKLAAKESVAIKNQNLWE